MKAKMGLFGKKKEEKKEEHLNDIKKEVIGKPPSTVNQQPPQQGATPPVIDVPKPPSLSTAKVAPAESPSQQEAEENSSKQTATPQPNSDNLLEGLDDIENLLSGGEEKSSNDLFSLSQEEKKEESSIHKKRSLDFSSLDRKSSIGEVLFVTTEQFKEVVETIDGIKKRIKSATDTYLRVMDIKAEEDIELENLRKDFEYIEDKLYQIDETLFN